GFSLFDIPQQKDFYKDYALPVSQSGSRAFVIISDALRFEVAAELNEHLIRETNGSAEISAVQSVFPSITKFGMAALLPHDELEMTDDIRMTCDGMSTEGTEKRQTVLDEALTGSCAVTYEALLAMKRDQRRELVSRAQVVYIYHNKIDAIGDESTTEHQVFEACKTAVDELTKLVRLIVNTMNGSNIIITSDHGFLYSYKPIGESEKADIKMINGELLESGRRYILADKQSSSEYLMRVPIGEFSDDIAAFAPLECIRIKKQGGGVNYVHGGISLQECCVPVISFKNARVGSKNFVDIKKAGIQLMSRTRKISEYFWS
ncbi:MAG: BREX-1 system phosphatase PglZ type A, partial [Ruminococcus sp.]|nr:BREX-1 system phosphatase PglZ type A [Ruminococcus sp.]